MVSKNLKEQLKKLLSDPKKVRQLKMNNGETVESVLKSEAQRLIDILEEEIEKVYSRSEGWYKRSNDLRNSIDKNISIDPQTNTITIGFLNDKAWHDSWITKTYDSGYSKQAYVPAAVIKGYEVFNSGHYVEGFDFVQNAVDRFNMVKSDGITVKIEDSILDNWWK